MLLCSLENIAPGTVVGASVIHPARADLELLRPGVILDDAMLARLRSMGVTQIWIHHDATADLDHAVGVNLSTANRQVFQAIKQSFDSLSPRTFFSGNFQVYREVVLNLIVELVSSQKFAGMTAQLLSDDQELFSHSANVAYLSLMAGLQLETYVVQERGSRDIAEARDMTNLGMGAMMHDIGKAALPRELQKRHAIHPRHEDPAINEQYEQHAVAGFQMLSGIGAPATMINTILHHHQRFDGKGWPEMTRLSLGRKTGTLKGRDIHIFSRIVAAANALDNLTRDEQGGRRPLVAAISDFADARFDDWFDPVVRACLIRCVAPFPMGSEVTLSNGKRAVVAAPNLELPCRPLVRPLCDAGDQLPAIDLATQREVKIVRWLDMDVTRWYYEHKPVASVKEKPVAVAGKA